MSSRPGSGGGPSFRIHFDRDGNAHVDLRLGPNAGLTFLVTREQQAKVWTSIRPVAPYLAGSVLVGVGLAFVATAGPPTSG